MTDSYAESLEDLLRSARDLETEMEEVTEIPKSSQTAVLRAAALVAVLSMLKETDERSVIGRQLGSDWSQDHRRVRMGYTGLMKERQKRSTWR
ncbi:MAG: hypothetical protein CMB37_06360 [Euryarchaeota archaeon]|nr:hypothetical protein [Euryarchaeota archaeon]MEC7704043.1 hypothetical protein [Candidatus Thermoplasmatota archaeon]MED5486933.1 hypothetical protein [Candidatus Thermoplasmatota archaeon]